MGVSRTNQHARAGRVYDPVFFCMVGAMVLAVASSVTLRAVMAGAGQLKNTAEEENTVVAPAPQIPRHKGAAQPRIPHQHPPTESAVQSTTQSR